MTSWNSRDDYVKHLERALEDDDKEAQMWYDKLGEMNRKYADLVDSIRQEKSRSLLAGWYWGFAAGVVGGSIVWLGAVLGA